MSGTSMATPHVAGFAAYLLGLDSSLTPAKIAEIIKEKARDGILSGVREFFRSTLHVWPPDAEFGVPIATGTINKLLNNPL